MAYYNPITTIASVGFPSTPIPSTISSATAPTTKANGGELQQGDTWWDPVNTDEYLYIVNDQGVGSWNIVGTGAATPATSSALGSVIIGTGIDVTTGGTISIADTAVTAGTYNFATITVDAQGRLTAASTGTPTVGTVTSVASGTGLTGGPITASGTLALADTTVTAGTYNFATLTVDEQGRLTAASTGTPPAGTVTNVATGTGLTGGPITDTGTLALADTSVTAGTYTTADITVDAQGRLTSAANGTAGTVSAVNADGVLASPKNLTPEADNTQTLGSSTKYFKEVYANGLVQRDTSNQDKVILTIRNNQIILTDTTQEITSSVDLGGTIPDPGALENVHLDGSGRYTVGANGLAGPNTNGLVTQEFINTPGQFFVINDIDGGVFGYGDRQCFGLIRETLFDGSDLDGGPALWSGGAAGGWSLSPFWYYSGGNPYVWTSYSTTSQTPGGSGNSASGTFSGQTNQRKWWGLCDKAQVGKKVRTGIADGTNSDQAGTDYTNRLIFQLYVSTEMLAHADASADLPAACITNGAGWYTSWATVGEYENMGSFPDGVDKGYRFRWSTFGNTTLSQLPYVSGVSNNDQIASATGLVYYIVYDPTSADVTAANQVLATGTTSANNAFFPSVTVSILQFNDPYTSFTTPAANIFDLKYTEAGAVQQSPMFHTYPIDTEENIIESSLNAAGVQKLRRQVCDEILDAVTGYYLIRDLSSSDRTTASAFWADIMNVALAGQLQNVYDLTLAKTATTLAPQILLDAVTNSAKKWINTFPVAGSGNTLNF